MVRIRVDFMTIFFDVSVRYLFSVIGFSLLYYRIHLTVTLTIVFISLRERLVFLLMLRGGRR